MTKTEELRKLLDERGVAWLDASPVPSMREWKTSYRSFTGEEVTISDYDEPKWLMGTMVFLTPEQAVKATLGDAQLEFLKRKVELQGSYIEKLTKEKKAMFARICENATNYAGQIDRLRRKLEEAESGRGTCRDVCADVAQFTCSACRFECDLASLVGRIERRHHGTPNYCPRCGRKVER